MHICRRVLILSATLAAIALGPVASANPMLTQMGAIIVGTHNIDFSGQTEGADVSNAYATQGITFNGLHATSTYGSSFVPTTAPAAVNFTSFLNVINPFGFTFSAPVTDVSFYLVTDGFGTDITSYLNGVEVQSFLVSTYNGANSFYGFSNTLINSVVFNVSGDHLALIDNVAYSNVVPEPASLALLGLGLAGFAAARRRKV